MLNRDPVLSVPDRRRLGHIKVIYVIVIACLDGKEGEKEGQWGLGKGSKDESDDSEQGASKGRGLQRYVQRASIPSKRVPYTLNTSKYHLGEQSDLKPTRTKFLCCSR